jgi:hypothetical protein
MFTDKPRPVPHPPKPVPVAPPRPPEPREVRELRWIVAAIRERGMAA